MAYRQKLKATPLRRLVEIRGNRLIIKGKINSFLHYQFMLAISQLRKSNNKNIILDFSFTEKAYPDGMVPLICTIDHYKQEEFDFAIQLPKDRQVERLFRNTNWAHLLDPDTFDQSDSILSHHLSARRFSENDNQAELVHSFMDAVMRNLRMTRSVFAGLEWSINEITDNVTNHAKCDLGGIVQVSSFPDTGQVAFAVADSGIGIKSSLERS